MMLNPLLALLWAVWRLLLAVAPWVLVWGALVGLLLAMLSLVTAERDEQPVGGSVGEEVGRQGEER